jgi:hypothetical protein
MPRPAARVKISLAGGAFWPVENDSTGRKTALALMSPAWPCLRLSVTHRRRRPDENSSLSRRSRSRVTVVKCHLPPRAVGIPRSFNSRAMAWMETKPAFRRLRIVGPKASARTSATRLPGSPLLIPPFPDVGMRRRVSILATVLRCHLPPPAPGIPPSVQFIRQRTVGNEACRHKLSNGREQSKGASVCGPLDR